MADTGTTKLSQRKRVTAFNGGELFPVVTDGQTLAGTAEAFAQYVAPFAPVSEAAQQSADDSAASAEQSSSASSDAQSAQNAANASAQAAAQSAASAQIASQLTLASARFYATVAQGMAGTVAGQTFTAPTADAKYVVLYLNQAGAAIEQARFTTQAYLDSMLGPTGVSAKAFSIVDGLGFELFSALDSGAFGTSGVFLSPYSNAPISFADPLGFIADPFSLKGAISALGGATFSADQGYPVADLSATGVLRIGNAQLSQSVYSGAPAISAVDPLGFVGFNSDQATTTSGATDTSNAATIAARNASNLAHSAALKSAVNSVIQRPVFDWNVIIVSGESLAAGKEGWPALSKTAKLAKMLGAGVRPVNEIGGSAFTPLGGAAIMGLHGNVQNDSGIVLTDNQIAALAAGDGAHGETPAEGLGNLLKKLHNQHFGVADDAQREYVVINSGVSGMTIAQWQKGFSAVDAYNIYPRNINALNQIRTLATAAGKTLGVVAIVWIQGANDYTSANSNAVTDKATHKALTKQFLRGDLTPDVMAITGQSAIPAVFTVQSGASYTRDANNLAIGMGQWELSQSEPGWYLSGPLYHVTNKASGHLNSNGYRWLGSSLAAVMFRVLVRGESWEPLSPRQATYDGSLILVDFSVPVAPLAFLKPYVASVATDYADKGFTVIDDSGTASIAQVSIVADTVISISVTRALTGNIYLRYADQTYHGGNGCVFDSDATVSDDLYTYAAGSGQYAEENIATLVGNPYPLNSAAIAFHIPVTVNKIS